jgi:tetratricopeptide (TPR) repeat protein
MNGKRYFHPVWLVTALFLFFPALGHCFSATAQVDQTRVTSQDTVTFQVVVEGGKADVDLSNLTDFDVLSSGTQTSRSYVNGNWAHKVVYNYTLLPKKKGVLMIPPLTVTMGGEAVMTREIQILVSETPSSSKESQAFFAKADLSSPDIVLGQQAVYTLKLYVAGNFAGASFDPPKFTGLMARELTKWKKYTRNIEGRVFVVNEIKFLVQGETAGKFDISPAVFMAKKRVGGSKDPFDSFFDDSFFRTGRTKPVRVVSNPVSLTINALPPYTGNAPFSGLVGSFTIGTTLDKNEIKVGESVTLTITIQGIGNIMDAGVPPLSLDEEKFKVYQDAPVEEIYAGEKGFEGKKIFKQALVPGVPGKISIPAIALTFFDTESKAYKTISTESVPLDVIPGGPVTLVQSGSGTGEAGAAAGPAAADKQEVVLRNRDILDIREDIASITTDTPLPMYWFIVLLILPGVGFALFGLVTGIRTREKSTRETLRLKASQHLDAAGKLDLEDPEVLTRLQAALTAVVLARGEKQAESLTRDEARQILDQTRIDETTTAEILALMDAMDGARFGGKAMDREKTGKCLKQVRGLIKTLGLVLCLGLVTLHMPSPASADTAGAASSEIESVDTAGLFIDSTRAYKAGEFPAAARGFESIAKTGVINSDLFYNTGNAWLKANDLGRAILWYERAKRLNPADPDLNFNLAHARTLVRDKVDTSLNLRDILFFWQGMVSLKGLQFMAIAGSLFFFTWAAVRQLRKKRIFSGAGIVICILACALIIIVGLESFRLNSESGAVILRDKVAVRSGTLETATALFDLHAGTRVRVLEKKGNHLKVRFAKGKVGWVSLDDAAII